MKGSPEVIKVLNEVLRKELTGINQYFVHSKVERILFLEGVPKRRGL
jgi:bacterioferritin (cytochrome b1)